MAIFQFESMVSRFAKLFLKKLTLFYNLIFS